MPTPESDDRSLRRQRGQIGAYALHSQYDSRQITSKARQVFQSRFEQEVDPDGLLPPEERRRRAEHARTLYYRQLAYRSAKARRLRRNADALDAEVASSEQSADDSGPAGAEDPQGDLEGGES